MPTGKYNQVDTENLKIVTLFAYVIAKWATAILNVFFVDIKHIVGTVKHLHWEASIRVYIVTTDV